MKLQSKYMLIFIMAFCTFISCKKEEEEPQLKNDLLKKTTGPAIIGERVEFVYALGSLDGSVQTASAEASIAGAPGTGFSAYSWFTNRSNGVDVSVLTARDTVTNGAVSTATVIDTNAVSLRYFYVPSEEARGNKVSFRFTGTSSTGREVSVTSPEYQVSRMDMRRLIVLQDAQRCYFSIADMAAYTQAEVEQNNLSAKIDFVYIYKPTIGTGNYPFGHALVALSNTEYINDLAIPASWTKPATLMNKKIDVRDAQLKGNVPNVYIDDIDLEQTTFVSSPDYAFGFAADQGAFVQTSDGAFNAYVYVNRVDDVKKEITISIKRLNN